MGPIIKARSFIELQKINNLVVLTVDKTGLQSVGVTQQEGPNYYLS